MNSVPIKRSFKYIMTQSRYDRVIIYLSALSLKRKDTLWITDSKHWKKR